MIRASPKAMSRKPRSHGWPSLATARRTASTSARTAAAPERASYGDVLLLDRVRAAIAKLNPTLTAETRAEVLQQAASGRDARPWSRRTAGCTAT